SAWSCRSSSASRPASGAPSRYAGAPSATRRWPRTEGEIDMTVIETEAAPVDAAPPGRPLTRSRRLPGWRLAARLARREERRRPARTALAALLVAIPVAGMVIGVAVTRFRSPLPEERWNREWGAVDIVGRDLRAEDLPPGSHVVEIGLLRTRLRTTDRRSATVDVSEVLPDEPLARDLVVVSAGRLPERADEVLLAPGAAEDLGVGVGDTVELDRPVPTRVVISGIGPLRSRQGSGWLMVVGP